MKMIKLDLSNQGLTTLEGIDLTGVTHLNCSRNNLTFLPVLPHTLEQLVCSQNKLVSLPKLPNKLLFLICKDNKLSPFQLYYLKH